MPLYAVTVMVAVPAFTPRTRPVSETVATLGIGGGIGERAAHIHRAESGRNLLGLARAEGGIRHLEREGLGLLDHGHLAPGGPAVVGLRANGGVSRVQSCGDHAGYVPPKRHPGCRK